MSAEKSTGRSETGGNAKPRTPDLCRDSGFSTRKSSSSEDRNRTQCIEYTRGPLFLFPYCSYE